MSAEVVRAALDEVVRFVVCPKLVDELRQVLRRERFRRYLSIEGAEVYSDAVEAASELVDDPQDIPEVSPDPDDDYLVALARDTSADAIVSGDTDLDVEGGPPRLTPRGVLGQLRLGLSERQLLIAVLWNLHLRTEQAASEAADPQLPAALEDVHSAVSTLGGDPQVPGFGLPDLGEDTVDVRDLERSERTACAYALELDRQTTGALHARYVDADRLPLAFEILDRQAALERVLE